MMAPLIPVAIELASQFAPGIIKYFTGSEKAAAVAGEVIDIAQTVTGAKSPQEALETLRVDAARALEFRDKCLEREARLQEAQFQDVQSARNMQMAALGQSDLFSKRFVYYFAASWSLFAMLYVSLITFFPPSTESGKSIAQTVLGFLLGTAVASIFNFFLGSTNGSMEKSKLLAALQPQK